MLYVIDGKYYMLRNREYVKVDTELKGNELSIKPDRKNVIEANESVKARGVLIDDIIKEKKTNLSDNSRNKYDR